jgi:hypothetical protein
VGTPTVLGACVQRARAGAFSRCGAWRAAALAACSWDAELLQSSPPMRALRAAAAAMLMGTQTRRAGHGGSGGGQRAASARGHGSAKRTAETNERLPTDAQAHELCNE